MTSIEAVDLKHFIGNRWRSEECARTVPVLEPGTGQKISDGPVASAVMVDEAARAATQAFATWGRPTPQQRSEHLLAVAEVVAQHAVGGPYRHLQRVKGEFRAEATRYLPPDDAAGNRSVTKDDRTAGKLVHRSEMKVVDATGAEVPAGEVGEALSRGPGLMLGYWRDPEQTRVALTADGWYRTRDLVRVDDPGYVYVVGRLSDMIFRGGSNVSPNELEHVPRQHPSVRDAEPDRRQGGPAPGRVRGRRAGGRRSSSWNWTTTCSSPHGKCLSPRSPGLKLRCLDFFQKLRSELA